MAAFHVHLMCLIPHLHEKVQTLSYGEYARHIKW